jgi:hypothetical protein
MGCHGGGVPVGPCGQLMIAGLGCQHNKGLARAGRGRPGPGGADSTQKAAAMMQQFARLFEAGIRAHPHDWHMLQRVYAADLDPGAAAARGRELAGVRENRQEGNGRDFPGQRRNC